ncbi:MAG: molybdopterin-dependent oxidoreductase, partial [Candidatus Tectomicrobia bacterium]|nr:molybdopterin-dependent oxidoreductase [Candidatus Tectomicrobia bacterium]
YSGFGTIQATFAFESLLDILAQAIGMDPLELRLKNAAQEGDTMATGQVYPGGVGIRQCLQQAARQAGWPEKRKNRLPHRGIGVACMSQGTGICGSPSSSMVRVNADGTVTLITGATDLGQGWLAIAAQIVAEELGVALEEVKVIAHDTDLTPYDDVTGGSRTTLTAGKSAQLAAADAKRQLLELAAERLDAEVRYLEARGGRIFIQGHPESSVTIAELAAESTFQRGGTILGKGFFLPQGQPFPTQFARGFPFQVAPGFAFSAQVAEVEVDPETGKVKVIGFNAAHDCGFAINPQSVEGQVDGGVARGLGFALLEESLTDPTGRILTTSFSTYRSPRAADVSRVQTSLVQEAQEVGPFGAKGAGEATIIATAPAIANAIYDAIGVRVKDLPITPEKVLKALQERKWNM